MAVWFGIHVRPLQRLRSRAFRRAVSATAVLSMAATGAAMVPVGGASASSGVAVSEGLGNDTFNDTPAGARGGASALAEGLAKAASTGESVSVPSAGSETELVTANPDGTVTTAISQEPVRVADGDGGWDPVDLTLQPEAGDLVPATSPQELAISADGTGPLASIDTAGAGSVGLGFAQKLGSPKVEGESATYPVPADPNQTVQVRASVEGFTARVVLGAAPGTEASSFRFPIVAPGLKASLDADRLVFTNAVGRVVAESAPFVMWDSHTDKYGDPDRMRPIPAELVSSDQGQELVLTPSATFLNDSETQYPVTIDPDINAGRVTDTFIDESQPSNGYAGRYLLRVGSPDGSATTRTIEQFKIDAFYGQAVTNATLRLFEYAAGSCTPLKTWAYSVDSPDQWGTNFTWANQPSVRDDVRFKIGTTFNAGGPGCANDFTSLDVTPIVASYASGKFPSERTLSGEVHNVAAIELRANREYNTLDEKRFCSMNPADSPAGHPCDYQDGSRKPVLTVTSVPDLGEASWYSMTSHKLNDRSSLKVNNDNGNAVIKAEDLQIKGVGQDLNLSRYYNSQADPQTPTSMGPHWSLSAGPDVWFEPLDQYSFNYHSAGGRVFGPYFRSHYDSTKAAYDKFAKPLGAPSGTLEDTSSATGPMTFELTMHNSQTKYTFKDVDTTAGNDNLYMVSSTDRSGNTIRYNYATGTHRLASITDTADRTITVGYTGSVITSITDPTGRTWGYGYNTAGRLSKYTDPASNVTDYGYTTQGTIGGDSWVGTITDPANASGARPQATLAYASGQATGVRYAASATSSTSVGYDLNYGNNLQALSTRCDTSDDSSTDVFSTDTTKGRITYCFKQRDSGGDGDAMTHRVVDGNGDKASQDYSADNQPVTFTSGNSNAGTTSGSTVATYGGAGFEDRLTSITDPKDAGSSKGTSTGYFYDTPPASVTGADYLPSSKVDANGDCTAYLYDPTGRLTDSYIENDLQSRSTPDGTLTASDHCSFNTNGKHYAQTYNTDGTVASRQDPNTGPNNARTIYTYWKVGEANFVPGTQGQLKSMTHPGGTAPAGDGTCGTPRKLCTSYTYDALARIATMTDGRGQVTTYTYDKLDRTRTTTVNGATTCQAADTTCVAYTYDAEGNMTSRQDPQGSTTWTYDRLNRQRTETVTNTSGTGAGSTQVAYGYNDDGKLTRLDQYQGTQLVDSVAYTYDTGNRPLTAVGNPDAAQASQLRIDLGHDHDGKPNYTQFPTSPTKVTIARTRTDAGRPKAITVRRVDGSSTLADTTFSYVQGGIDTNHLQKVTVTGASNTQINSTITYGYTHNKLTSSTRDGATPRNNSFDAAGNLTKEETSSGTLYYGYDRAGQLCWKGNNAGSASQQLGDACTSGAVPAGDTHVNQDAAGNSTGTTTAPYTYNGFNQVSSIAGQDQGYNDLGNDLRVRVGDSNLVNSSLGVLSRTTAAGTANEQTTFYLRDPEGNILASHTSQADGGYLASAVYYVTDQQGSTTMLIDSAGARAGYYRYSPWGDSAIVEDANGVAASNPWRYLGAYFDNVAGGYHHLGARFYDNHGHFTQPDPKSGDLTDPLKTLAYGYAGGDPVNQSDRSGRDYDMLGDFASFAYDAASILYDYGAGRYGDATATSLGAIAGLATEYYCAPAGLAAGVAGPEGVVLAEGFCVMLSYAVADSTTDLTQPYLAKYNE